MAAYKVDPHLNYSNLISGYPTPVGAKSYKTLDTFRKALENGFIGNDAPTLVAATGEKGGAEDILFKEEFRLARSA